MKAKIEKVPHDWKASEYWVRIASLPEYDTYISFLGRFRLIQRQPPEPETLTKQDLEDLDVHLGVDRSEDLSQVSTILHVVDPYHHIPTLAECGIRVDKNGQLVQEAYTLKGVKIEKDARR